MSHDVVAGEYTNHLTATAAAEIKQWGLTNEAIRKFEAQMREAQEPKHSKKPLWFSVRHFRFGDAMRAVRLKITGHKNEDIMHDIQSKIKAEFALLILQATEHNANIIAAYKRNEADAKRAKDMHLQELEKIRAREKKLGDLIKQFEQHQQNLENTTLN